MVRLTDRAAMTIDVDLGRKATKQTNKFSRNAGSAFAFVSYLMEIEQIHNFYWIAKIRVESYVLFFS